MTEYYDASPYDGPGPSLLGDRPLPHSAEMETAVLSCLLQNPGATADTILGAIDSREGFYVPTHRTIYDACKDILDAAKQLDLVVLADRLDASGSLDTIGGMDFLRQLRNRVPTVANVDEYVMTVQNLHQRRKLISQCTDLMGMAFETDVDTPVLLDDAERRILEIGRHTREEGFIPVSQSLDDSYEMLQGIVNRDPLYCGIPSGFRELDSIIMGFRQEEMIVLAARPSIGKTGIALNIMQNIAGWGTPVGFVSLEMGLKQLVLREILSSACVDLREAIRRGLTPSQWETVHDTMARIASLPIYHYYHASKQWADVRRLSRQVVRERGVKILFIDYLQLLQNSGAGKKNENREQEVARLSGEIKSLAQELSIPIIVLAQLNRASEGNIPRISDLRESGAIEQDADIVALLHRKREADDPETAKLVADGKGIPSQLFVAKDRNGPTGVANLVFFPQYTLFDNPPRICDEDIPL